MFLKQLDSLKNAAHEFCEQFVMLLQYYWFKDFDKTTELEIRELVYKLDRRWLFAESLNYVHAEAMCAGVNVKSLKLDLFLSGVF